MAPWCRWRRFEPGRGSLAARQIACTSSSRIGIELGHRRASLQGEVFLPGFGDLDLLIPFDQPRAWLCGAPFKPILKSERVALQNAVLALLTARGTRHAGGGWRAAVDD